LYAEKNNNKDKYNKECISDAKRKKSEVFIENE
jgi:hypothetical protein